MSHIQVVYVKLFEPIKTFKKKKKLLRHHQLLPTIPKIKIINKLF